MLRKTILLAVIMLLFLTLSKPVFAEDEVNAGGALLQELLNYVYESHLDEPDLDVLVQGAIDGMLGSLDDPYTEYFTQDNLEQFKESLDGNFVGVGIRLSLKDEFPYVEEVISGSPALRSGLKAGDILVKVEGENIEGRPLVDVVDMIRGPESTTVNLTILRDGKEINFQIIREVVNSPTVMHEMLDEKTGYIVIESFGSATTNEFDKAMNNLMALGMQSLILDLRNNPGGYLNDSVEIAGHFIPPGKPVVSIVNRDGRRNVYRADGKAEAKGLPLVVLVNGYSASASEVLAGALRDYESAVLVGEQTYGKGVVQSVLPLKEGGALKLTVSKYLTPLDHDLNLVGLKPDKIVLTPGLQLPVARQIINLSAPKVTELSVGQYEVLVNGEEIVGKEVPFVEDGRIFVPLRFALESLAFEVSWETGEKESGIKISGYNKELFIPAANIPARLNKKNIALESGVILKDGVAFISVQDLRVLNIKVSVNNGKIRLEI